MRWQFKEKGPRFLLFFLLVLSSMLTLVRVQAQDVSFDITQVKVNATVASDGDVKFQDIYTYDVDYMNGALFTVDYDKYNLTDYRVGVMDGTTGEINYLTEGIDGAAGTYRASDTGGMMDFKVYYPVESEQVQFVYEYTLENLITNYNDTAEFNFKIVGGNTEDNFRVDARIDLPAEVSNVDDFRVWAYGAPTGEVRPVTQDGQSYIELTVPNNPANQFVEVNAIFPTALTPNNTNIVESDMKQEIIDRSQKVVEEDAAAHQSIVNRNRNIALGVAIGFPFMTLVAWVYYLRKRRQLNPNPAQIPEHIYTLPADITPAVMATAVLRSDATATDFSATIMDLARKGYIEVEEVARESRGLFSRKSATTVAVAPHPNQPDLAMLHKHERYVYDYLLPNNEPTTLATIEENIKSSKTFKKEKYRKWTQFANYVKVKGEQIAGRPGAYAGAISLAALSMVIAVMMFIVLLFVVLGIDELESFMGWIFLFCGVNFMFTIILFVLTLVKPVRTYEQDKMIKEWKAFAKMLNDIGNFNIREIASLPLWEEFLVYAISLDVADKVIEAMNKTYGMEELEQMAMPMVIYQNPYWISQSVNSAVSQSIASSAPPQSSYSGSNSGGFGGGFSSGSSGGGGGGGGAGGF